MDSNLKSLLITQKEVTKNMYYGMNHTKVKRVEITYYDGTKNSFVPKTWSSTIRWVVSMMQMFIDRKVQEGDFEHTFNKNLALCIDGLGYVENASFSRTIFTDDSYIKSSLYKSNKNHKLKLFEDPVTGEDKYICAVYSGEVIWVLDALVKTLKDNIRSVEIIYCHKKQHNEPPIEVDTEEVEQDEQEDYIPNDEPLLECGSLSLDKKSQLLLELSKVMNSLSVIMQELSKM